MKPLIRQIHGAKINVTELYRRDKGLCQICHQPVRLKWAVLDHIIPKVGPGQVDDSPHNLQIAHGSCNSRRSNGRIPAQMRFNWDRPQQDTTGKKLPTLTCLHCDHTWVPRIEGAPVRCPKCQSPYWNRPRKGD